jgi:hypothetical protein
VGYKSPRIPLFTLPAVLMAIDSIVYGGEPSFLLNIKNQNCVGKHIILSYIPLIFGYKAIVCSIIKHIHDYLIVLCVYIYNI